MKFPIALNCEKNGAGGLCLGVKSWYVPPVWLSGVKMMDLKDFVAATLEQILEGVTKVQSSELGRNVNAENVGVPSGKNVFSGGTYGTFTLVEFDVAVSAETAGKGGANLQVFGVGFEGGGEHKAGHVNRISFAIPVRLPDGDRKRAGNARRESQAFADDNSSGWTAT